jgi:hypothetical protein
MWFLVRVAFWLSVVILFLPSAPSQHMASAPQVSAGGARSAAIDAAVSSQAMVQFAQEAALQISE